MDCKEIKQVNPKGNQSWTFIGRIDAEAETPILWPPDAKNWLTRKRPWCWEKLKAGGEGDDRGWDDWMASPTRWTWACKKLRRLWWTGKPGVLQSTGSEVVRHNWTTEQVIPYRPNSSALWDLSFNGYNIKLKFCKYNNKVCCGGQNWTVKLPCFLLNCCNVGIDLDDLG